MSEFREWWRMAVNTLGLVLLGVIGIVAVGALMALGVRFGMWLVGRLG